MWSISRRKSLINCPRQYILRYSRSQRFSKNTQNIINFSLNDLVIRSSRKVIHERLEDFKNGLEWSEKMISLKIRLGIKEEISSERYSAIRNSSNLKNLIHSAKNRINSLWNTNIFRRIISGQIKQWSCMDRKKFLSNGHIDIFCSPDISYKIQKRWHLLRIDFQGELRNPSDELESLAMVNWAKKNNFLPYVNSQYIVNTLKFINGKWIHNRYLPTDDLLQQSKQLLEKDVNEMNKLVGKMGPLLNLALIPLSNNRYTCKKCSFKPSCPAKNGLRISKLEQNAIEYNNAKINFESNG
ncbi:MAG: hypothetical protein DWB99_07460 [Candidatus Poseidoniales archaeon]|nr:MAG: hypothetical protein DWB99_07460 [Candidatus Poseidoniales archaeon]